jgi:hypothetical protein
MSGATPVELEANQAAAARAFADRRRAWMLAAVAAALGLPSCGSDPITSPPLAPFKPRIGVFLPLAPLPEPRAYLSVIEVGGFVYAVGGLPPLTPPTFPNATSSVFVSRVLPDGRLEPWGVTSALNVARSRPALAAWTPAVGTRYLLAIGGHAADSSALASIERAFVQPDGTLSPWELVAPLPAPRHDGTVAQASDFVVLPGGFGPEGNDTRVTVATLGPEGLGPWRDATPLPERSIGGSALVIGRRIHRIIGNTTGSSWSTAVYSASLDSAGGIAAWDAAPPLGVARYFGALTGDGNGGLIMVGGISPGGGAESLEHTASDRAGNLLGWTPLGSLPAPTGAVAALGTASALYVFGGIVGSGRTLRPTADVWGASLRP